LNSLFVTEYSYRGVPEKIRTTKKRLDEPRPLYPPNFTTHRGPA
jgi:hypothetical protein